MAMPRRFLNQFHHPALPSYTRSINRLTSSAVAFLAAKRVEICSFIS